MSKRLSLDGVDCGVLALETSTDACSVALANATGTSQRHEVAPRQHSQRLFELLGELLPVGGLRAQGVHAVAYGSGPGSFTGLRIAASAAQGLAFASGLPVVPVPSLAVLAQSALRMGRLEECDTALCLVDARLNEVYAAVYSFTGGYAVLQQGPWACAPEKLALEGRAPLVAVGDGCAQLSRSSAVLRHRVRAVHPELLPHALDVIPLARQLFARGASQTPAEVNPDYVRDEINWKKLSEQGRQQ